MSDVKIKIEDREYSTREEEFEVVREEWNEYRLVSGGRVRMKTSVVKIFQAINDDGSPLISPDGEPVVLVRHATQISASAAKK